MKKKVFAQVFVKLEAVATFKTVVPALIKKTREEKGCLVYNLFEQAENPGMFVFVEEYQNQEALDFHFNSPYLAEFGKKMEGLQTKEMIVDII